MEDYAWHCVFPVLIFRIETSLFSSFSLNQFVQSIDQLVIKTLVLFCDTVCPQDQYDVLSTVQFSHSCYEPISAVSPCYYMLSISSKKEQFLGKRAYLFLLLGSVSLYSAGWPGTH